MTYPWPDNWVKLTCANGHVITEYHHMEFSPDYRSARVYGFCPVCREPWCFQGVFDNGTRPERVPVIVDSATIALPPLDLNRFSAYDDGNPEQVSKEPGTEGDDA